MSYSNDNHYFDRYLDYGRLGIKTFPLNQHKEALETLHKGSIAKAIFKID